VTADEVRRATFRDKLRGYAPADVDPLLEEIAKNLDAGRSIAELVHQARLRPFHTKFRGYHPADVDAFLRRLSQET
jgi:DivIVA domain-containing protein